MNTLYDDNFCDTSFCDAKANICDEIVLKFSSTPLQNKIHVKRLSTRHINASGYAEK